MENPGQPWGVGGRSGTEKRWEGWSPDVPLLSGPHVRVFAFTLTTAGSTVGRARSSPRASVSPSACRAPQIASLPGPTAQSRLPGEVFRVLRPCLLIHQDFAAFL